MMPRCNRQKLVDALLKSGCILFPEQIMQKDAHGIHPHAFGPSEFPVDLFRIERRRLPHLQLIDRVFGNVVAAHQPGLLRVPIVCPLLRPARSLRTRTASKASQNEND